MEPHLAFLELHSYLTTHGHAGVTEELEDLLSAHEMERFDLSDGNGIVLVWRSVWGPDIIELLAVSPDGAPFDFTLRRLQAVETENFTFGAAQ